VSFLPQSTAAAIIKKAAKTIFYQFPEVGSTMRLLIHDSLLGESRAREVDECLRVSQEVMESPIEELPLDPTWNMGEYLTIQTEAKVGKVWGEME
jgi:DNA polymerase I-like protein with 3'-5' exonuclease and polymerase domains